MRELRDHIVEGDSVNHQLKIEVQDEPGPANACHRYLLVGFDVNKNPSSMKFDGHVASFTPAKLLFQYGPVSELGVNGITNEMLLAVLIDRLRSFQAGPFACDENGHALTDCLNALSWLQHRTHARISRGVEGQNKL